MALNPLRIIADAIVVVPTGGGTLETRTIVCFKFSKESEERVFDVGDDAVDLILQDESGVWTSDRQQKIVSVTRPLVQPEVLILEVYDV